MATKNSASFRFGVFEFFAEDGQLRKHGALIRLSPQPSQVLTILIAQAGEVVSREELQQRLWGEDDTSVEFDAGLNRCIRQIRAALNDDAEAPRYISTVPRRGYRFIAPVERVPPAQHVTALPESPVLPEQPPAAQTPVARTHFGLYLSVFACLAIVLATTWWFLHRSRLSSNLYPVPLAVSLGDQLCPTFSPDGRHIAYVWNGEREDNFDIYMKAVDSSSPALRLTTSRDVDYSPAWSPDGQWIAFCRGTDSPGGAIYLLPALGGPERKVTGLDSFGSPASRSLAWSTDSRNLVVSAHLAGRNAKGLYLVNVNTGDSRKITAPSADEEDMNPAVSADGRAIAFTRDTGRGVSSIMMISFPSSSGKVAPATQLTPAGNSFNAQPAWTPDSGSIVFATNASGALGLRLIAARPPRSTLELPGIGPDADFPAVSRSGALAFVHQAFDANIWKLDLREVSPGAPLHAERVAGSTRMEESPAVAPDGTRIAFESNRSGYGEVWTSKSDGSNPVQITFLQNPVTGSPDWSPDGRRIVMDSRASGRPQIYLVPADGGTPRQLTSHNGSNVIPRWSADGATIYYSSDLTGRMEVWQMPSEGGASRQVTFLGGFAPALSRDGERLYYASTNAPISSLWQLRLATGEQTLVSSSLINRGFAPSADGVYFLSGSTSETRQKLFFFDKQSKKKKLVFETEKPAGTGMALAADGFTLFFTQLDQRGHELLLVNQFWSP